MLSIRDVSVAYGVIRAVRDVSIRVEEGEIVALLGPNGAGKTSLLSAVAGLLPVSSGSVTFGQNDITSAKANRIVREGLSLTPEGRRVFVGLTVEENLRLGGALTSRRERERLMLELFDVFPILEERKGQGAELLSGGEQQMLAIARSLMARPKLLMLDEPSLGLAPIIVERIFELLTTLREDGLTVLVVEQHAHKAIEVADRVYVMNTGEIEFSGGQADLAGSDLMEVYFGGLSDGGAG